MTEAGYRPETVRFRGVGRIVEAERETFADSALHCVRVEGAVVWRHVLGTPKEVTRREGRHGERKEVVLEPVRRWLVHAVGDAAFRLVEQNLRDLTGLDLEAWREQARNADVHVIAEEDAARWLSTITGPFDVAQLIAEIEQRLPAAGPHDRAVVPFTLRKALVEHGYDVLGVVFLPSF
ncbi:MAG: hypothetical protein V4850_03830 [Myxococcota bacterium]